MPDTEEISMREASQRLGVLVNFGYVLLWSGKIKGYKVGNRWRISAKSVEERLRTIRREFRTSSLDADPEPVAPAVEVAAAKQQRHP